MIGMLTIERQSWVQRHIEREKCETCGVLTLQNIRATRKETAG